MYLSCVFWSFCTIVNVLSLSFTWVILFLYVNFFIMIIIQVILDGIGVATTAVNIIQFYRCSKRNLMDCLINDNNI